MTKLSTELHRRHQLLKDAFDAPLILTAYTAQQRSADMAHAFTQEASFFWATGVNESGWQAVFVNGVLTLIAPERDEVQQLFDGGLDHEEVLRKSGAAKVLSYDEANAFFEKLADKYETVYVLGKDPHAKYYHFEENSAQAMLRRKLKKYFTTTKDARPILSKLRAIKSKYEIACIQKAIDDSVQGFRDLRRKLSEGAAYEYELEAELSGAFRKYGSAGHAYEPIVASGKHACTLHYAHNNDKLPKNGLVLVDAGASAEGYAADVTRTYAIGVPTPRQIEIHAAVERAHYRIIEYIKPNVLFKDYITFVDEVMKDALQEVGILKNRSDQETYRKYFPHAISHGLGLDVHESLGGYDAFRPGMVLTVEPGIYIPEEGIGVRIEDDILVTETGSRTLSADLPTGL